MYDIPMTKKIHIEDAVRPETASDEAAYWLASVRNGLDARQQISFDSGDFVECNACSSKPGSPALCSACLANRHIVTALKNELRAKRSR